MSSKVVSNSCTADFGVFSFVNGSSERLPAFVSVVTIGSTAFSASGSSDSRFLSYFGPSRPWVWAPWARFCAVALFGA